MGKLNDLAIKNNKNLLLVREGLKKKGKKRNGFIQCSSDPSQPGRAMDKKNKKFHNFFMSLLSL